MGRRRQRGQPAGPVAAARAGRDLPPGLDGRGNRAGILGFLLDPLLKPLGNYGGPTQTHAVLFAGKPVSEGMEKLYVELTAAELQAKDGKADLSKIELESVIVWVVKQKFPPPAR